MSWSPGPAVRPVRGIVMTELPVAREIRLRKTRPLAPPFHKHIARNKLIGSSCRKGDRVVVYEVTDTVPEGQVTVSEETIIHFDQE